MEIISLADVVAPGQRQKSHNIELFFTNCDASWGFQILNRLKSEYPKGKFNCICKCYDSTLVKEGAEIWQNGNMIKIYGDDGKYTTFKTDYCPVCGEELFRHSGEQTNGMRII